MSNSFCGHLKYVFLLNIVTIINISIINNYNISIIIITNIITLGSVLNFEKEILKR